MKLNNNEIKNNKDFNFITICNFGLVRIRKVLFNFQFQLSLSNKHETILNLLIIPCQKNVCMPNKEYICQKSVSSHVK